MIKNKDHINHIFCTGINYKSSSLDLRESFSLGKEQIENLYSFFLKENIFSEVLILSTCNRLEIYGVFSGNFSCSNSFCELVWKAISEESCVSLSRDFFSNVYNYEGGSCLRHLFKVVTSLDSLCFGETQITGQYKKAYQESSKYGMTGFFFNRINREALTLNRHVRNKTDIGKKNQSMSHLAIDLALHIFQTIEQKSFTLIGAGKMIDLAYHYALEHNPKSITILNRTEEKAKKLLKKGTNSFAKSIELLNEELLGSDIVISSTGSKTSILTYDDLNLIQKKRDNKPLFIIDIALPRDIDPKCSEIENIYLFDLDDIRKIVQIQNKAYKKDILIANGLIDERVASFEAWLVKSQSNDMLNNFGNYLNELFLREEERTLSKKNLQTISNEQKTDIRKMLQSISRKILSDTAVSMRVEERSEEENIEIKLSKIFIKKRKKIG